MHCDECGFVDDRMSADETIASIRKLGGRFRAPLTRLLRGEDHNVVLRTRPEPTVWSALEYAAHVRDVFAWYDERVHRSLVEEKPVFEGPGPDEHALAGKYNEQDPASVADAIAANAEQLAATLESVPEDGWERVHIRYGEERSVLFTARRAVHEGNHHLLDIGRVLRAVREAAKD